MKRILLEDTKLGGDLAVSFEQDGDEIGLTIGSYNIISLFAMEVEAWQEFVKAVNRANIILKLEGLGR